MRCLATLASHKVVDAFETGVGNTVSFIALPLYSPLSLGAGKVWIALDNLTGNAQLEHGDGF